MSILGIPNKVAAAIAVTGGVATATAVYWHYREEDVPQLDVNQAVGDVKKNITLTDEERYQQLLDADDPAVVMLEGYREHVSDELFEAGKKGILEGTAERPVFEAVVAAYGEAMELVEEEGAFFAKIDNKRHQLTFDKAAVENFVRDYSTWTRLLDLLTTVGDVQLKWEHDHSDWWRLTDEEQVEFAAAIEEGNQPHIAAHLFCKLRPWSEDFLTGQVGDEGVVLRGQSAEVTIPLERFMAESRAAIASDVVAAYRQKLEERLDAGNELQRFVLQRNLGVIDQWLSDRASHVWMNGLLPEDRGNITVEALAIGWRLSSDKGSSFMEYGDLAAPGEALITRFATEFERHKKLHQVLDIRFVSELWGIEEFTYADKPQHWDELFASNLSLSSCFQKALDMWCEGLDRRLEAVVEEGYICIAGERCLTLAEAPEMSWDWFSGLLMTMGLIQPALAVPGDMCVEGGYEVWGHFFPNDQVRARPKLEALCDLFFSIDSPLLREVHDRYPFLENYAVWQRHGRIQDAVGIVKVLADLTGVSCEVELDDDEVVITHNGESISISGEAIDDLSVDNLVHDLSSLLSEFEQLVVQLTPEEREGLSLQGNILYCGNGLMEVDADSLTLDQLRAHITYLKTPDSEPEDEEEA